MWFLVTAFISGFLTWLESDHALRAIREDTDQRVKNKIRQYVIVFVAINSILSVFVYFLFVNNASLSQWAPIWRATFLGLLYPALVRLKFATVQIGTRDLPVGVDFYYERIRKALYRRVDNLIESDDFNKVEEYARNHDFQTLVSRAKYKSNAALALSSEEKEENLNWIDRLQQDKNTEEPEKKKYLAQYLLFGRTSRL